MNEWKKKTVSDKRRESIIRDGSWQEEEHLVLRCPRVTCVIDLPFTPLWKERGPYAVKLYLIRFGYCWEAEVLKRCSRPSIWGRWVGKVLQSNILHYTLLAQNRVMGKCGVAQSSVHSPPKLEILEWCECVDTGQTATRPLCPSQSREDLQR